MVFLNTLTTALQQNKLKLAESLQQKLLQYLVLMQRWNKVFNLTSITEPHEMVYLHLIDSLLMQPFLQGEHLLDVGSGAGLPGIPLAIINPQQQWTLIDKNNKKTRFMTQAVAELGLKNVTVVNERSEDFQPTTLFDTIISRAYSSLEVFTKTTEHLLATDGIWLAMKGKHPQDEFAALPSHFRIEKTVPIDLKGIKVERCVVMLKKTA